MPVNFMNYLEKYTEEHNPNKSPSIVENYKALKRKLSECEELQTFVNNSEDKELRDVAALDIALPVVEWPADLHEKNIFLQLL